MKVAYLLGWSGSGKSRAVEALTGFQVLKGDAFLKGVARSMSPFLDGSWSEPRFWEGWARTKEAQLAIAFLNAIRSSTVDTHASLLVEGTLFGWAEVLGPFHAALQHLAGQELEHRRYYIEVDASTIASRIKARIDEGHRPGPPVPPDQIAAHLASYHERLAEQGVFVAGRGDALVDAIRSYLDG